MNTKENAPRFTDRSMRTAATEVFRNLDPLLHAKDLETLAITIKRSFSARRQALFGIVFSIAIVILAHQVRTYTHSGLFVYLSVSISVITIAFLVGVAFYLVLCIPQVYRILQSSKFEVPTLLPYQTVELKRIADIGITLSIIGAILSTAVSCLVLGLALLTQALVYPFWRIIMIGVLGLSWATVSIPFIFSQRLLSHIIVHAKEEHLQRLSISVGKAKKLLEDLES